MAFEKIEVKVRTCVKACFDGAKVAGGTTLDLEEFGKKRSSRISMYGTDIKTGREVAVVLTPRMVGVGEFRALNDIIEREGTFSVLGEIQEQAEINGELVVFDPPRVLCELSDENGEATFEFKPRPVAKWASKYGEYKTDAVDYGKDEEATKAIAQRRRQARAARKTDPNAATGNTI
jgi:hypothetical protein